MTCGLGASVRAVREGGDLFRAAFGIDGCSSVEVFKDRTAWGSISELPECVGEGLPVWVAAGQRDPDLAYSDADLSSDAEQLGTNGLALRPRPFGPCERQASKGAHEDIGGGRQIESELVGAHCGCAHASGE